MPGLKFIPRQRPTDVGGLHGTKDARVWLQAALDWLRKTQGLMGQPEKGFSIFALIAADYSVTKSCFPGPRRVSI